MPSAELQVAVLHTVHEDRNRSMALYARGLGDALAARGLRIEHVAPRPVLEARTGALATLDSLAVRFLAYPAQARRLRADVFHVVDHAVAGVVRGLDPARTVVTCHDLLLLALEAGRLGIPPRDRLAARIFRRQTAHLRRVAAVAAVSERTRRDLVELLGVDPARVEVIPPGLNHGLRPGAIDREAARRRLGLRGPVLLHVGQAAFYKNVEGCLRVLARVREGGLPATLARAGEPLRPAQRALAERLGVAPHVLDLGPVSAEALAELYGAADVLLFPSLYEGFGWPPLEAMAAGLPVVCSDAGALPEVAGAAGRVVPAGDEAGLAGAVAEVCTRPALAEAMRARGLAQAARYGWDRTAASFEALYRRLLGGGAA